MKTRLLFLATILMLVASQAQAWWNGDWSGRKKITLDATATGADVSQPLQNLVVPVRLHTGNFIFANARDNGADLRFVAADEKTVLPHHIEQFDAVNELAVVWVQVPAVAAGAKTDVWMYYGNAKAEAGATAKAGFDANQTAVLQFSEADAKFMDRTAHANHPREISAKGVSAGPMGGAAQFDGAARIVLPATPSLKLVKGGGFTFSAWVKPAAAGSAVLFSQQDGGKSLRIALDGEVLKATVTGDQGVVQAPTARLKAGAWQHVAITVADQVSVFLDGQPVGSVAGALPDLGGEIVIGEGFKGDLDEVQLSNVARSAAWIKAAALAQGPEGRFVVLGDDEAGDSGGGQSYLAILLNAVTLDGWVVIGILGVMAVISWAVMVGKTLLVGKMDKANQSFIEEFRKLSADMVALDGPSASKGDPFTHSSLFRVYRVGVQELKHRFDIYRERGMETSLTPQAIDAIRASLDAGVTRESHRLNAQMVYLTIAISGGPFLGLLGTVVGVMITFAAIAAAGDVNVNAIAPGIAAALVATVAGLAVAIPALFGYNYLTSKIKNITTDMHVFGDEFITKLAENYSA